MGKRNLKAEIQKIESNDYLKFLQRNIGDKYGLKVVSEFRFHPIRKWRFDYFIAIHHTGIAIEVDGGIWIKGRHVSPQGFLKDMEKFNYAASMGYYVFKFTPSDKKNNLHLNLIKELIEKLLSLN